MASELSVEHLAKVNFMNNDYFSRIFKAQMGIRPLEYIQGKRIERASTAVNHYQPFLEGRC